MLVLRPMIYLTADRKIARPPDSPDYPCVALHFDNQAGRPDDLVTIVIRLEEAAALRDQLNRMSDDGDLCPET